MKTGEVLTLRSFKELKTRPKNTKEFCKITILIAALAADCVDSQNGHSDCTNSFNPDNFCLWNLDWWTGS